MKDDVLSGMIDITAKRTVGIRDIPLVLLSPRRLFARVEDVTAYAWPLVILLTIVTMVGYAMVETGLIDQTVDRRVATRIAELDRTQRDVVERSELRDLYKQEFKKGEFERLLVRIQVVIAEPLKALAAMLLITAVLYGAVALTGRKPEWHTLLTICVYAGFIDALRLLLMLGLMLRFGTLGVDTSPALLAPVLMSGEGTDPVAVAALWGLLAAFDPFRIWYWLVVIAGLSVTMQLPGWRAWLICGLCWLLTAGIRCGLTVASVSNPGQ